MKIKINSRFGVVPHTVLSDCGLSMKAKGLYAYIQSKPDDWEFSAERISIDCTEGRDAIRSALRELEKQGFLVRHKTRNADGSWACEYELYEFPQTDTVTDNPSPTVTDYPTTDNPTTDNPSSNKKRNTKKEIQKKKTYSEKIEKSFQQFSDHRKNIKKPVTQRALDMLESKIDDWQARGFSDEAIASFFDESVMNGWTGVFERQQNKKSTLQKLQSRSQDFF